MTNNSSDPKLLLNELGSLSAAIAHSQSDHTILSQSLEKISNILEFDLSIIYRASNVIGNILNLEVVKIYDPNNKRPDLREGRKLSIDLEKPEKKFINETTAFKNKKISVITVPGAGCDIADFIYIPESMGKGYLFSSDYVTVEKDIMDYEKWAFEIMCNMLSASIMKNFYEKRSTYDALTKIFNSGTIKNKVKDIFEKHKRDDTIRASVILSDIDYFKSVNDTYGHLQGDVVLEEFASILSSHLRSVTGNVGRYGGEEFLIVLENADAEAAGHAAERIRQTIEEHKFKKIDDSGNIIKDEFLTLTASFGVASLGKGKTAETPEELISRSDQALYRAKESGRNRVAGI
ncbi:MAG: GGDEF domain-containing protein [bacterium]|nr:GGDEF domain-containing protein [bacterium]